MSATTLFLGGALALTSSIVFAFVGHVVLRRTPGGEAQLAGALFSAWWVLLSVATAGPAILLFAAALGYAPLWLHTAITDTILMAIAAGLACLLFYLVYIYTGERRWLWPIVAGYTLFGIGLLALIDHAQPLGVRLRTWSTEVEYVTPISGGITGLILVILLVGPQILAAIGYLTLFFRVTGRARRYRIVLVSLAIIIWFGSSIVGTASGAAESDIWQLVTRLLALAAALTVLIAYRPPARVRAWLDADAPP